ncbi:TAXI family TRAP transporter solute-binding subunit [Planctomycetes bacterium K23_9]|uniref:NMT1/THI5 like protein n=1 Tax=Stieleria marina TaxID=1930275 RepID=A0A517P315_9BACT|nr:NMT1/THI5 like protein [Planctomycetes bacterium K23_9]
MTRVSQFLLFTALAALIATPVLVGCKKSSDSKTQFLSMGTAPVGGAFPVVGGAIAEVLNAHQGTIAWKVQAKGTKGSQENIRRLEQGELELALSNAAISYFAVRGEAGWDKNYNIRAIATMAPNVALFIARSDSGIKTIADLKGKRVITGPSGAGFQMFIEPILKAHGIAWEEITSLNATQSGSVDQLGDGSADAAFLGGAVPTGSITQATSTFDVTFVPFEEESRQKLIKDYAFFHPFTIPAKTYKGMEADYLGLNVGSMHVITAQSQPEELIYEVTKTIWENRAEIAGKHPAGKALNEKNIARDTGIEYHPGAIKFYKEAGVWPEGDGEAETTEKETAAATP